MMTTSAVEHVTETVNGPSPLRLVQEATCKPGTFTVGIYDPNRNTLAYNFLQARSGNR